MLEEFPNKTVKIGDNWYEYSTPGNIIYGFYGKAAGFTDDELYRGAGTAQQIDYYWNKEGDLGPTEAPFYGDTEDDHYAVRFGIYLYDNYYKNDKELTKKELLDAFDNYEYADKMALRNKPENFLPRNKYYRANHFYQE
jgi:hypothetical protein